MSVNLRGKLIDGKNQWPLGVYDCLTYKNKNDQNQWFPEFCPKSMICANSVVGRIHSKVVKEKEVCCSMGNQGLCLCVVLIPLGIYTPTSGFGLFCCISNCLRHRVMQEYNVEETKMCCVGTPLNPICDFVFYGINYPCSLFQVLMSVEHFENIRNNDTTTNGVPPPISHQPL